ncbi:MAG TPA: CotD family spore coat protein [Bacillales bacterium]|nr:CotD family spore coat protein [Bacillales bacterium]
MRNDHGHKMGYGYGMPNQVAGYGHHQPMPFHPANCGYPKTQPAQQKPPKTLPAQYDPVNQNTTFTGQDVYIPVIHPTHTTHVTQTNYKYMHAFPHTQSVKHQETCQHFCAPCQPGHHWK